MMYTEKSYKYSNICLDWSPIPTLSVNNMDSFCIFFPNLPLFWLYLLKFNFMSMESNITSFCAFIFCFEKTDLDYSSTPSHFTAFFHLVIEPFKKFWTSSLASLFFLIFDSPSALGVLRSFFLGLLVSSHLVQGPPTPGPQTGTGPRPVRNWATQQEVRWVAG